MSFLNKAKDWLSKNPDKANTAIEKVGDLVDKRTNGKYASQVDKAQDAARRNLAKGTGGAGQPPAGGSASPCQAGQPPANPPAPPTAPPTS